MVREKISTTTVLLLAHSAKNLQFLYVRKNALILKVSGDLGGGGSCRVSVIEENFQLCFKFRYERTVLAVTIVQRIEKKKDALIAVLKGFFASSR